MEPDVRADVRDVLERRVLVLAPFGRDAALAEKTLARAGMPAVATPSAATLIEELHRGVGVMVVASEALDGAAIAAITAALSVQPSWSEIPIVILTPNIARRQKPYDAVRAFGPTGNVTFLPRPLTVETLLGTVRFALRSRMRQYEMRTLLAQLDRHATELKRSNDELENFAFIAAHDMQEPIRMIDGHLGLIARRHKDALGEAGMAYLDTAVDGAKRMRAMLQSLLKYAHVGKGQVVRAPVSLRAAVAAALANLSVAIEASGGTVEVVGDDLTVPADESLLTQLFQNLVGNAVKFQAKGVSPRVRIQWTMRDHGWRCSISDNGIGIAKDATQKIFNLFQRQNSVAEYPGSGIGLATCRRIVELHGGRISVDSEPGAGSTFTVEVEGSASSEGPSETGSRRIHIVVIDDNPDDILLMNEAFAAVSLDVRVTTASDGVQAQHLLAQLSQSGERPDLITLDLNMPRADGFAVLEFLRSRALLPGVPLIVLTTSSAKRDRDRAIALGADQFTRKPSTFEELVHLIQSWRPFLGVRPASGRMERSERG